MKKIFMMLVLLAFSSALAYRDGYYEDGYYSDSYDRNYHSRRYDRHYQRDEDVDKDGFRDNPLSNSEVIILLDERNNKHSRSYDRRDYRRELSDGNYNNGYEYDEPQIGVRLR